jgi:RNase P subunit RPR2
MPTNRSKIEELEIALEKAISMEGTMGRSYFCPHCRKLLNPGQKVVFLVENGSDRELVLLSAELGDYSVVHSRAMSFKEGRVYTFRCPLCRSDLSSTLDEKLVDILTEGDDGALHRVSFSRVFGEQATFLRTPAGVDRYGKHTSRYDGLNFFGVAADPENGNG